MDEEMEEMEERWEDRFRWASIRCILREDRRRSNSLAANSAFPAATDASSLASLASASDMVTCASAQSSRARSLRSTTWAFLLALEEARGGRGRAGYSLLYSNPLSSGANDAARSSNTPPTHDNMIVYPSYPKSVVVMVRNWCLGYGWGG